MNNRVMKLFATIFITAMLIGTISAVRATPPSPPAIWVEPEAFNFGTHTTHVGDTFVATLWISCTVNSYAWQVKLHFNPAQLAAVSADYTGVGKSMWFTGLTTVPVSPTIDNITGTVLFGESLMGAIVRGPGSDTLFTVTFKIIAAPPFGGSLTSNINPTDADSYILDPDGLTIPGVSFGLATYTFTWEPPTTHPHLEVTPARSFDQYTHWVGTHFTEDLMINNLDAAWLLSNVTTHMSYNNTLTSADTVVFDPIWGSATWSEPTPGDLLFDVSVPTGTPSGDVKIATITFTILNQGESPPRPFYPAPGSHDDSVLHCHDYNVLGNDGALVITTDPAVDATVEVRCFQLLTPPHLEVSSVTMGPGPVLGQEFNVTVSLVGVHYSLNVIGIQFRLTFDKTLIYPTAVYEGPFLGSFAALQPGSLGTWFISFIEDPDGTWGPHVLVGNMIYPNGTGWWNPPMLNGSGVLAIITFKVMYQSYGEPDISSPLNIEDDLMVGLDNLIDQNIIERPLNPSVDGTYTITSSLPGREIDVYGGAVNSGYGPLTGYYLQFPAPYGGQGPQAPMDLVEEQSYVYFHANVTYNYWPVQHKLVGFQVNYPDGSLYANLFAYTDENGVATVEFRMPWPCENPESLFGVWHVVASVQLADVYLQDTLDYHYDYLVRIWKVTTDKYQYNHGETVEVCVTFGSHAQQDYPILLKVHIADELGVIFGHFEIATHVGGTQFCTYRNTTLCGGIWIPKWAYAGIATVHVNIFDQEPILGGAPWTPEYTPPPTIAIQPY